MHLPSSTYFRAFLPVKLDILSGSVQKLQESVDDLVLAHALVPDQQQVFPQSEILHHVLHHTQVLNTQVESLATGKQQVFPHCSPLLSSLRHSGVKHIRHLHLT